MKDDLRSGKLWLETVKLSLFVSGHLTKLEVTRSHQYRVKKLRKVCNSFSRNKFPLCAGREKKICNVHAGCWGMGWRMSLLGSLSRHGVDLNSILLPEPLSSPLFVSRGLDTYMQT